MKTPDTAAIALVEDHSTVRSGIRAILEKSGRYQVLGEAATGREALARLPRLQPDIILLDISLPDMTGMEILTALKEPCPNSLFVGLSMYHRMDYIEDFLQAGARGYLTKASESEVLLQGLELIRRGEYFLDRYVMEKIISRISRNPSRIVSSTLELYDSLTRREQEVFRLLAQGFTTKQAGYRLKISHRTIENHKSTIMRKLQLETSVDLVRYAQQIGILD